MTVDLGKLPRSAVAPRINSLRELIVGEGLDGLLVTRLVNIRYLTGFTGSAALLLVTPDEMLFVSDGRYGEQAAEQLAAAEVEARIEIAGVGQREILQRAAVGLKRIGFEASGVTWSQHRSFDSDWFPEVELVATEEMIEGLRRVKDPGEIARVRAACSIADEALMAVRDSLREGVSEQDFALELEMAMRTRGASGMSFDPIVAAGENGAKPHARPSDRRFAEGDLVVLDFGCVVDGYCSDMTRTVAIGTLDQTKRHMYEVVLASQEAGRAAVRAGASCADIDRACREIIDDAGWGDSFTHGTGHGVGLEIHEAPRVAGTGGDSLLAGDIVTVEPGVYLPDIGGVRIEDTVVVTPEGCDVLTESTKSLPTKTQLPKDDPA